MVAGIIIFLSLIGVIYGVASYVLKKQKADRQLPNGGIVGTISLIVFVLTVVFKVFVVQISAQQVGVVITPSGVSKEPLETGWHLVAPYNEVQKMDKTIWVYSLVTSNSEGAKDKDDAIWAPTSDGIKMGFDISVNWKIEQSQAPWIYANIASDQDEEGRYHWMEENIIRPAVKSIMPLTVSNYTPIECYSSKRSEIQAKVQAALIKELKSNHIVVEVAQIREVYYNKAYEDAINAKKLAEQEVLRLVEVTKQQSEKLKQAEINKNIAIEQSEGEAEALKIKGQAIAKNPKIVQLEWIAAWKSGGAQVPKYLSGSSAGQMFMMNMGDK